MKDISVVTVIDEAVQKLEKVKENRNDREQVMQDLYAVRAYCELLIRSMSNSTLMRTTSLRSSNIAHSEHLFQEDEEANGTSLFDF